MAPFQPPFTKEAGLAGLFHHLINIQIAALLVHAAGQHKNLFGLVRRRQKVRGFEHRLGGQNTFLAL